MTFSSRTYDTVTRSHELLQLQMQKRVLPTYSRRINDTITRSNYLRKMFLRHVQHRHLFPPPIQVVPTTKYLFTATYASRSHVTVIRSHETLE